ncbi:MAG: hypothetical protein PWR01_4223, partial [Clostridiales bacterium]|nr:hypothetical protein [Clostridiales bacterium]MDN5283150.1 hypothetical protein [Candidatus Ozemobacter sp.]
IMAETSEKKKALDARIRAVLPEGYLIRHSRNKISRVCAFFENSQPLLVSFEKKYLEMPEIILSKVIADYFGYLICEDAHGKILPASVALPIAAKNSSDEAEIRSGFLNQELEKLWNIWNRDVHALPGKLEKISEQITDEGFVKTELFSDFNLMGIAESLCDFLGKSSEKALVSPIIRLIEEGEKTEIGRLLQGTGFSVIYNRLMGVDAFQPYAARLKEICQFFEERISVPENETSRIISLAILLHGYIEHVRCFDCSPERILSFLNCTGLKMDLFGCFHQLFPTHRFDRKCWFEAAFKVQSRESGLSVLFENLSGCSEFDPASFFAAYRDWKEISADELESFTGLVTRLRSKLNGINRIIDAQPDEGLETEISTGLTRIEKLPGVDYLAIYKFYQDEKVNIEACLMNLPAVLDDTSSELSSRISLLQRLQRQFSRLPLVKKEKRSEKI